MSVFNEFLPRIDEISNTVIKNFKESLQKAFESIDKFEEDILSKKIHSKEALKDKNVLNNLQSIDEEDSEKNEITSSGEKSKDILNDKTSDSTDEKDINDIEPKKVSKKRSKNEVDDMSSPEVDKRQKRTASVVAQNNISKQVNVNLTQKLRRGDSERKEKNNQTKSGTLKDEDKENEEPIPVLNIKVEKSPLPPQPMDLESFPINIEIKQEKPDEIAMPPPVAPIPKPRRAVQKVNYEESTEEEYTGRRRTTRSMKHTESVPPATSTRAVRASTRASSRATQQTETEEAPIKESRPKRTRTKKLKPETSIDTDKDSQSTQDSGIGSPAEKQRPKRTRKAQKAVENNSQKKDETLLKQTVTPTTEEETQLSPILQLKTKTKPVHTKLIDDYDKTNTNIHHEHDKKAIVEKSATSQKASEAIKYGSADKTDTEETKVPNKCFDKLDGEACIETKVKCTPALNTTVTLNSTLDKTVVLPNGVYNHAQVTPTNVGNMNKTVVIEKLNCEAFVLDKPNTDIAMDATMVIEKRPESNLTDDNSILTDDNDTPAKTPPRVVPNTQSSSAVKEKVQQFEELASRVTRTKTRQLAKKVDSSENHTPPDKVSKVILSAETLNKMNNMIFNGKVHQTSSSAVKTSSHIPTMKQSHSSSTSKLNSISKAREAAEEFQKKEKEDARKKKEALLEAKREAQRKKREEKMAAAAAARELAEKERHAAMEVAIKERMEKQAHVDLGKLERLKEVERKKQELARKVAETEERRKAEEQARAQRLVEEQRKAEAARKKHIEENEAMKKEAVIMAKEIEKRKREYLEKQKKMRINGTTPLKTVGQPCPQDPVYMMDGFQYLNSDSSDEEVQRPLPRWDNSKHRSQQLYTQEGVQEVDTLFLVGPQSPDLRAIFPDIDRAYLKRTSSAIWRTPPAEARYQK